MSTTSVYQIVGYTFQADLYCPDCIVDVVGGGRSLDEIAATRGIDREDEWSFDSDDFPKVAFAGDIQAESDLCAACEEFLDDPFN